MRVNTTRRAYAGPRRRKATDAAGRNPSGSGGTRILFARRHPVLFHAAAQARSPRDDERQRSCPNMSAPGETFVPVQANAFSPRLSHGVFVRQQDLPLRRARCLMSIYSSGTSLTAAVTLPNQDHDRVRCSRFRSVTQRPSDQTGCGNGGAGGLQRDRLDADRRQVYRQAPARRSRG